MVHRPREDVDRLAKHQKRRTPARDEPGAGGSIRPADGTAAKERRRRNRSELSLRIFHGGFSRSGRFGRHSPGRSAERPAGPGFHGPRPTPARWRDGRTDRSPQPAGQGQAEWRQPGRQQRWRDASEWSLKNYYRVCSDLKTARRRLRGAIWTLSRKLIIR